MADDPKDPKKWLDLGSLASPQPASPNKDGPKSDSKPLSKLLTKPTPSQGPMAPQELVQIRDLLILDIQRRPECFLGFNPTRRIQLTQYLCLLSGTPAAPESESNSDDLTGSPGDTLSFQKWLSGPRSKTQEEALQAYLEELALFCLAEILLLKAWSDRNLRRFTRKDLTHLNHALSEALRDLIPMNRDGWLMTSRNLFSWYQPSLSTQEEIFSILSSLVLAEENPERFLSWMLSLKTHTPAGDSPRGYDLRIFKEIWKSSQEIFGGRFEAPLPIQSFCLLPKTRFAFSPTLRDGACALSTDGQVTWIGSEGSPFLLAMAEMIQAYWGPKEPPLYAQGLGLDLLYRDQMSFGVGGGRAPTKCSAAHQIAELESCELAIVVEEEAIRSSSRSAMASAFRSSLESVATLKKFKSPKTTLGTLQALVAFSKLRPGGLLWWLREEPLHGSDCPEALKSLFEKGRLLCEWNLSELTHRLPGLKSPLPRFLYLFERDLDPARKAQWRPERVQASGHLRSHVELSPFLEELLHRDSVVREHWKLLKQTFLPIQSDWIERWPETQTPDQIQRVEKLRTLSEPIGMFIKFLPLSAFSQKGGFKAREFENQVKAFSGFLMNISDTGLETHAFGERDPSELFEDKKGSQWCVLVPNPACLGPVRLYLESALAREWLSLQVNFRSPQYKSQIQESLLKMLPFPRAIANELGWGSPSGAGALQGQGGPQARPLPEPWERCMAGLLTNLDEAQDHLRNAQGERLRAALFVRAARAAQEYLTDATQSRVLKCFKADASPRWESLLSTLPPQDLVSIPLHPRVSLIGEIPPHMPIGFIENARGGKAGATAGIQGELGVRLATDSGHALVILPELTALSAILRAQIDLLKGIHPTWSEIINRVRLPRRPEILEAIVRDLSAKREDILKTAAKIRAISNDLLKL